MPGLDEGGGGGANQAAEEHHTNPLEDEDVGGGARVGRRPRRSRGGRDLDEEEGVAGWQRRRLVGRVEGDSCGGGTG